MIEISSNYVHFLMLKFSWYEYIVEEDSELKDSFNLITKCILGKATDQRKCSEQEICITGCWNNYILSAEEGQ